MEHKYQVVRYKQSDGKIIEGYFPKSDGPDQVDVVPGTNESADFLDHARSCTIMHVPSSCMPTSRAVT